MLAGSNLRPYPPSSSTTIHAASGYPSHHPPPSRSPNIVQLAPHCTLNLTFNSTGLAHPESVGIYSRRGVKFRPPLHARTTPTTSKDIPRVRTMCVTQKSTRVLSCGITFATVAPTFSPGAAIPTICTRPFSLPIHSIADSSYNTRFCRRHGVSPFA